MDYIDMHTHTRFSDGSLSPYELVALAKEKGLLAIAITDHDTTSGVAGGLAAGQELGIEVVPGIEVAADYNGSEIHILGYGINHEDRVLKNFEAKLKTIRVKRNSDIVKKLADLHIEITQQDMLTYAKGGLLTRMDFAVMLTDKAVVRTIREAFDVYLGEGKPAYAGRDAVAYTECIDMIHNAGGIAALAHPYSYRLSNNDVIKLIKALKHSGLDAVEVYYTTHTKKQENALLAAAKEYQLKITGGSDFHGSGKPDVALGSGFNYNLRIPYAVLTALYKG